MGCSCFADMSRDQAKHFGAGPMLERGDPVGDGGNPRRFGQFGDGDVVGSDECKSSRLLQTSCHNKNKNELACRGNPSRKES